METPSIPTEVDQDCANGDDYMVITSVLTDATHATGKKSFVSVWEVVGFVRNSFSVMSAQISRTRDVTGFLSQMLSQKTCKSFENSGKSGSCEDVERVGSDSNS